MRRVIACYVDEIRINPEDKTGKVVLNAAAFPFLDAALNAAPKESGRPAGRPCVDMVAGACCEAIQKVLCCWLVKRVKVRTRGRGKRTD